MSWFCINPYDEPYMINNIEIAPLEDVQNKVKDLIYTYRLEKFSSSIDKITKLSLKMGFFYLENKPEFVNLSKEIAVEIQKLTQDKKEQYHLYLYSEGFIENGKNYSYLSFGGYWKHTNLSYNLG
jgi:hypothetical protein